MTDIQAPSQDAREAAADLYLAQELDPDYNHESTAKHIRRGAADHFPIVQAFACFEAHLRSTIAARDTEAMRLLREAREQLNDVSAITGNLQWRADLGKLVDRIDTLTSAAQDGVS